LRLIEFYSKKHNHEKNDVSGHLLAGGWLCYRPKEGRAN
jgi:hypothetical protein